MRNPDSRAVAERSRTPVDGGNPRGRHKKKSVTPMVGGWVKGQKWTRVRFFPDIFLSCF
jgi:hypothetical protein